MEDSVWILITSKFDEDELLLLKCHGLYARHAPISSSY